MDIQFPPIVTLRENMKASTCAKVRSLGATTANHQGLGSPKS